MEKSTTAKSKWLMTLTAVLLLHVAVNAQEKTGRVKGIIRNENGKALSNVSVIAKNTLTRLSAGTETDSNGIFTFSNLPVNGRYSFSFSAMGFESTVLADYTLKPEMAISIIVKLHDTATELANVVVIGYGTQRKRDITTSVAGIKAKDLENQPVNNVAEAMAGKLPGVQITQGSGEPGNALTVKVRGVGTITAGSDPLYVIDGVPTSGSRLNSFNTNDIESVEVLKDASSAAIYGSRGANGVVIITTKQGKKGKPVVSLNSYTGIQEVAQKIKMLDAYQYADLSLDAHNNSYIDLMESTNRKRAAAAQAPLTYSINDDNATRLANTGNNTNVIIPRELLPYLQKQPGLTNTNWQDEIFRRALMQNHTLSVSGGNDKVRYYSSLEYFDQDGIIINSNFKRYGARFNLEANQGIFKFGVNVNPTYVFETRVNADGAYNANGGGIIASALHYAPIFPVYNADGTFNFGQNSWSGDTRTTLANGSIVSGNAQTQAWNPVALAKLQKDEVGSSRILGNVFTEAAFTKDLKYRISLGVDLFNSREDKFRPSTLPQSNTAGNPASDPTGSAATTTQFNWVLEQTLNYHKRIKDHSINAVVGWTTQKETISSNTLSARGFISNQITTLNAGIVSDGNSRKSVWALASALGRIQYNYKGRYLLTTTFRADGASRFGKNNKWGYFPSASVGWRISDEAFMQQASFLSDLKIRASYGLTGNFSIPNYGAQGAVTYYSYILGGATPVSVNGAAPSSQPNPNLSWEKTAQFNAGIDASFFHDKLMITVDCYNSNTRDLLLDVPVPISTGYTTELQNIGKVNNRGIELNLGTQQQTGSVKWSANINFSKNVNKVKELGPGNADIIKTGSVGNAYFITRVDEPIGSYYLPVVLGVFKNQAEVDKYPHYIDAPNNYDLATSKPGDFKFLDADGDGVIDLTKDRMIVGNYLPDFTYGFTVTAQWKSIDFLTAIQGVYGNKILNLSRRYFYNHEGNMNNYAQAVNRFKSEADPGSGWNVRANRVAKGSNGTISTWHVEDGSYLRIRNITVGYSVPEGVCKRLTMSKVRLYVALQNPYTFTKYMGYNPEVTNRNTVTSNGEDYGVYPTAKTASAGINITF